ncbi:HAD-IA family hydrolase [Microtetraspora sp. NBRC 16547]|uniref:HAD family hydrolase n=1 Tax=Microtetraspora sp. NBRC 16547 TaxID=3030993 RepID=UPI0024A5F602|nr:HAD-IA family hydrolase [Microtetraspora sp. NBRC 16547]GLW99641.1 haloacid dehalogenase [Microtetraspora sp. NBRC 16547]
MTNPQAVHGRPFDAVLCDLDGVIRFYDMTELTRMERVAGLAEGTTAKIALAPENDLPVLRGEQTVEQWGEVIAAALADHVPMEQARELAVMFTRTPFRADENVVEMLRLAQAHVPVVLVTNATPDVEDDLALLGLAYFADEVVNSARVGVVKPDAGIYEIAAERAGVPMDRCLFIDDRAENVEAAVALGMTGVLYGGITDLESALAPLLDMATPY